MGVREEVAGHPGVVEAEAEAAARGEVLPVHTPILRLAGEPKSQKRPLCGSQGSRSVHSSPSCLAHTRQQPQPSSTRLTPAGHRGAGAAAHWHRPLQSWPEEGCGRRRRSAGRTPLGAAGPSPSRRVPPYPSPSLPESLGAPRAPAAAGVSARLPGCRGRAGARRRSGRRTWSGRCGRRVGRGRPGAETRARADWGLDAAGCVLALSAGAAAVGLEAVGLLRLELHWLPSLCRKSCCVRLGRAAPGFYTLRAAPARQ